jgi:RIO kinase 1
MGQRMGKSKARARKYQLKERNVVDSGIFDEKTMISLGKFFNKGIISKLNFVTARGKEADLYIAEPGESSTVKGEDYVIMKFFRVETSSFFKMEDYIMGDPRFERIKTTSKFELVKLWCKKEFGNLEVARRAGVHAPKPFMFSGSILAMSFIGEESIPAPQLRNIELEYPEETFKTILDDMRKLYKNKLVHGDMSEYNILISGNVPYMIDFGQAVVVDHPHAMDFLSRDVSNILSYFSKTYGIEKEFADTMKRITSARPVPS